MILKDFFNTFKHQGKQVEDLQVYFYVCDKKGKRIHCGYSMDFGYTNDGKFIACNCIVNHLNRIITEINLEVQDDLQVIIDIEVE